MFPHNWNMNMFKQSPHCKRLICVYLVKVVSDICSISGCHIGTHTQDQCGFFHVFGFTDIDNQLTLWSPMILSVPLLPVPNNSTAAHNMFRPFLSRYSACPFLIGDTKFSPEKTWKTKRGKTKKEKERKGEWGRERTRERELMMVGRDKVLVWGCMPAHKHCELPLPTSGSAIK